MSVKEDIFNLTKQLLPTGRAFRGGFNSNIDNYLDYIAESRTDAFNSGVSLLDSLIPDNNNFTVDDATDWERRLGLISNPDVPLTDRKAAILRKMQAPGVEPAKGSAQFLQTQLQAAGFNVYIYENIFSSYPSGFERRSPAQFNASILTDLQHGDLEHGEFEMGSYFNYIIANSISNSDDVAIFNSISDFSSSFFIGGLTYGSYASVSASREPEFRQLVLTQKQSQNIGFGFINFI